MTAHRFEEPTLRPPFGELERALIDEFLRSRGYTPRALADLAAADRQAVMTEASIHASTKLMELEARSRLIHEIHGDAGQTGH